MSAKDIKVRICNMIIKNGSLPNGFDGEDLIGNRIDDLALGRLLSTTELWNNNS